VFNREKSSNLLNGTDHASELALIEDSNVVINETFPVKFPRKCHITKLFQKLD
jgi:hypothetical protein